MDPITCLSIAGTAVQFLDFAREIISAGHRIYKHGKTAAQIEAKVATEELLNFTTKLEQTLYPLDISITHRPPRQDELALQQLCQACNDLAHEFLERLKNLQKAESHGHKHRAWNSFYTALLTFWAKSELVEFEQKLLKYRAAIDSRILSCLRDRLDSTSIQQSKRFDELDDQTKQIATSLLDFRQSISKDFDQRILALCRLINRREVVLVNNIFPIKRLTVNAFQETAYSNTSPRAKDVQAQIAKIRLEETEILEHVARDITESLSFPKIRDRVECVSQAHSRIFEWIYQKTKIQDNNTPWSNFPDWLENGNGIYWISGRAGSGKSTIMKYICENPNTQEHLRKWASGSTLLCASYFLWNSGTLLQKNQIGLLRSLLYDTLLRFPALVPVVFPSQWAREYPVTSHLSNQEDPNKWTLPILLKAFETLISQDRVPIRLCLFVDGLDEYEGDEWDMVNLFRTTVISPYVKVCVSSRPQVAFAEAFAPPIPGLALHDLTKCDIRQYVDDKLVNNVKMEELSLREPICTRELVLEIVDTAHGVSLWVELIVASLLRGLSNHDRVIDLQRRLRALPPTLEELFDLMVKRIDKFYEVQASEIYQLVGAATREAGDLGDTAPLTVLELHLAQEDDSALYLNDKPGFLSEHDILSRCKDVDIWLKSRCGGLLEVGHGTRENRTITSDMTIGYLHRTVRDYLKKKSTQLFLLERTPSNFNPNISLLTAAAIQLSARPKMNFRERLTCLQRALSFAKRWEMENASSPVQILDELWKAVKFPWLKHPDDMLCLAIRSGLTYHVKSKLTSREGLVHCISGQPLLDYATNPPKPDSPIHDTIFQVDPDMVLILLEFGTDPNQKFHRCSPWQNALSYLVVVDSRKEGKMCYEYKQNYASMLTLMLRYGANGRAKFRGPRKPIFQKIKYGAKLHIDNSWLMDKDALENDRYGLPSRPNYGQNSEFWCVSNAVDYVFPDEADFNELRAAWQNSVKSRSRSRCHVQ